MDLFNAHIANWALREIPRTGARYTWTNHQLDPVRSVLDRVFVSNSFEGLFPLCSLVAETSLGSDHTPLVLDTGEGSPIRSNRFFFETGWFDMPGFNDVVLPQWQNLLQDAQGRDVTNWWNIMSSGLRQYLRGWSRNLGRATKQQKQILLGQIANLDLKADSAGLDEDEWAVRYHIEDQLM